MKRTIATLIVITSLITTGLAAMTTAPAGAQLGGGIVILDASVPADLVGGHWFVTVHDQNQEGGTRTIAQGLVPASGEVVAPVALRSILGNRSSDLFILRALKRQNATSALLAVRTAGIEDAALQPGSTIDFGSAGVDVVPVFSTLEAAVSASECETACGPLPTGGPGRILSDTSAGSPALAAVASESGNYGEEQDSPEGASSDAGSVADLPMSDCTAQGALCGTPTTADTASASEPGTCRGGLGYYSCVISAHDVTGVLAFRGWSHRIQTMTSRFRFYSGSQQEWDNGYRVDAGGFSVSGNTVRTKSNGVTDTWPTRSDCYTNSSYNSGDCTSGGQNTTLYSEGHLRMYGRDTWRWEKQLFTLCDGGAFGFTTCSYITDEHVFETAYNGGTEIGDSTTYSNYNKPPSGIRLNHYGAWTKYLPGTTREDFLSDSYSHSNGATVGMNFPESYGAATFSSRMTNTTPSTMKNNDIFAGPAGRLPWMSDPNPSTGSLGWTYLYDMGSGNKAHWISCELATGWTLPSDTEYCWRAGS